MDDDFEKLKPSQLECLRLAARGKTSKEIAKITGYAPATVDSYLSRAAKALGAGSRREAALILLQIDRRNSDESGFLEPFLPQSSGNYSGKAGFPGSLAAQGIDNIPGSAEALGEEAGVLSAEQRWSAIGDKFLPPIGGHANDLTRAGRIRAAMNVALFSAMVFLGIIIIFKAITIALSISSK